MAVIVQKVNKTAKALIRALKALTMIGMDCKSLPAKRVIMRESIRNKGAPGG